MQLFLCCFYYTFIYNCLLHSQNKNFQKETITLFTLVVVCGSYLSERHMEKKGQISKQSGVERNKVTTFAIQACTSIVVGK